VDEMKGDPRLKPMAFRPSNQLPEKLPDGAHRVISEMTSAKMRMMMQGIVVEGTGKRAHLNGYSAAGKTGTAQKIDPATHTYSHTKLVASFAGFAPVSNPAISVTVVIDNPTVGSRYGAETSAPVFADVAQQVLEYLGVPHDQPLQTKEELRQTVAKSDSVDDGPVENGADVGAMLADVDSLPTDDPLRAVAESPVHPAPVAMRVASVPAQAGGIRLIPAKVLAAFHAGGESNSILNGGESDATRPAPAIKRNESGGLVVDAGQQVPVPSFVGAGLRSVVVQAAAAGLRVQPLGSGLAREQTPVAGTMVPSGSEVVVRFIR
jgi:cell division protein FtsI (penicillin-binding protein 3)